MSERLKTGEMRDQTMKDLINKLKLRDREMQDLQEQDNLTISELNKQIQSLQSDLNQKDYELQVIIWPFCYSNNSLNHIFCNLLEMCDS